jgi:oligoendopeptidase F
MFFTHGKSETKFENRSQIPLQETWNLTDLYATDGDWETARKALVLEMDDIIEYKGKLSSSSSILLACLELNSTVAKEFQRLYTYASMKSDEDTRNDAAIGMRQTMTRLGTDFNSITSFMDPELVAIPQTTLDAFLIEEKKLHPFKMVLHDLQRRKKHTLSHNEEKILAEAGLLAEGPHSIYNIFSNAELPYPEIRLSDGTRARLDPAGYARYRALTNREDREKVFESFFRIIGNFKGTFGAQLNAQVQKDIFYARTRKYGSSLESAMDPDNIPVTVYHSLIQNVHSHLNSFYRYLKLRQRILDVDVLKYSDIYAPTVKGVDLEYSFDEAKDLVLKALAPMGEDYLSVVKESYRNRWIDVYPMRGKRSGAYSSGDVYDVHPYILMNYNGKYSDVSTLAHELGHLAHSYLSNKTQPYPMARYSIFVAEVASTFNEALLHHALLQTIDDSDVRLSLLMEYLDGIKGTIFRQSQFAEFELRIHETAERGEPLTGQVLTEMYSDILRKYYGHDQSVCLIDDLFAVEWAYIPHFYYHFYVYQYATSFTASTALAESVITREKGAVENMIAFLSAGSSKYPIDLLKQSGVDMLNPEPFKRTMEVMDRTMDDIELILNKKGR